MANINVLVKRKQYLWLGAVALAVAAAIGGGYYFSQDAELETHQLAEPAPDLTGVVDNTFDDRVQQHAITQTQAAQAEINKQFTALRQEIDLLNKSRLEDQKRMQVLEDENNELKQFGGPGAKTTPGNPAPGSAASLPPLVNGVTPEGEPMPTQFPPAPGGAVPPPTAFYPGKGVTPPPSVDYKPIPVPGRLYRKSLVPPETGPRKKKYPYIPTGSFAKSILIEGADANASVTGNTATVPMQVRLTGRIEMPNSKTYDATGCFISMEAYGDVSSERAIVRTRKISCIRGDDIIDQDIDGHVSFMGKNGVKGEVVMRNGKILGFAWGAGFLDGLGEGAGRAAQPTVGLGATASVGAGDIAKSAIGGGASKAASTLSDYYIKRAEQYHPVIPIGAGNEVTVVFQEGFQMKTIEEVAAEKESRQQGQTEGSDQPKSGQSLNGFNTDQMLNHLGKLDPAQFGLGASTSGGR